MAPMGRPPKILDEALVDGVLAMIELGVYPSTAAQANGIDETTLGYWLAQAAEWQDCDPADYPEDDAPKITAYVNFSRRLVRAEARGIAWHEVNVRAAATDNRRDGRLSLEFLSRRRPDVYRRRDRLDVTVGGREPAVVETRSLEEAQAAFLAVDAPDTIEVAEILPALPSGDE